MRIHILTFDSLPSTNTEAARQARQGAPEGLCVVAREQTMGRGREGRSWISPPDAGIYFSIVLRPYTLAQLSWPLLTLMSSLAVRDALVDACALEPDIKWPNDILVEERKLCGILAETMDTDSGRAAIVGIGVNLDDRAYPPEIKSIATSIASLTGRVSDREGILQSLTGALARRYDTLLAADGEMATIREWTRHSSYAEGRNVRVTIAAGSFEGTTRGLEPDGALRVETTEGELRIVRAGDVTSLRKSK